jgi:hypothetical protein
MTDHPMGRFLWFFQGSRLTIVQTCIKTLFVFIHNFSLHFSTMKLSLSDSSKNVHTVTRVWVTTEGVWIGDSIY